MCSAYREEPAVRLAYLQVVIANAFQGRTNLDSTMQLTDTLDVLEVANSLPTYPKPARTITTAKSRLGLNVDDFIEARPVCSSCFKYYSHDDLAHLEAPECLVARCPGIVYREKRIKDRSPTAVDGYTMRRIPAKIQPYSSLIKWLRCMAMRPNFSKYLRNTSRDASRRPVSDSELMHDFHDGAAWQDQEIGLKRVHDAAGVHDEEIAPGSRRKLVSCTFGFSFTINMDWFGITENRPHSAGGVYVSLNNLDRRVRFLQHNVHLTTVIPGPKEPSLEQLNFVLEPLMGELQQLYGGTFYCFHFT